MISRSAAKYSNTEFKPGVEFRRQACSSKNRMGYLSGWPEFLESHLQDWQLVEQLS